MLVGHDHERGAFDAGHCRACAVEAGLLDHYDRVQREEAALRETHGWARQARSFAMWALWDQGWEPCWPSSPCWRVEPRAGGHAMQQPPVPRRQPGMPQRRRLRVAKRQSRHRPARPVDRRTPSGRLLPY
jgi:hypothetical protein